MGEAAKKTALSAAPRWLSLALVAAAVATYWNSFACAFLFDDVPRIVENPQIRHLWPPWRPIVPSARPVLELSLALNYAAGGARPWGYHAFNLAVHVLAGLALFGIVRRTLERARCGAAAAWLALAVAALWLLHPLQTESVTYVIQRAESLMGLFLLLTLYCAIRGWTAAAVAACALGMATKEVMVVAPLVVLLYDRTFRAGSFAAALRARPRLYAGLAATWGVLGLCQLNAPADERQLVLVSGLSPFGYALTQCEVVVHYLRLSFWPDPLVLDYLWPVTDSWRSVAPAALLLVALLAATAVALWRRSWLGFCGAWFFLILAPTSSVMPIADVAFEHRMYLPLAAILVAGVVGGYAWLARAGGVWLGAALCLAAAAALGAATVRRNADYASALTMWSDNVAKRPENPRAHLQLGLALKEAGRLDEAIAQYEKALRLKPDYSVVHDAWASALARTGEIPAALAHWNEALRIDPANANAQLNFCKTLVGERRLAEAIDHCREAARLAPRQAGPHNTLGIALAQQGELAEAAAEFEAALRLDPDLTVARENLHKIQSPR